MATLSKLSPDQRQQLLKQHEGQAQRMPMQTPTANLPSREVVVETPDEESFEEERIFKRFNCHGTHDFCRCLPLAKSS